MPAIAGVATSTMRSASRARSSTLVVSAEEARTMRMFAGRRCRNNSHEGVVSGRCPSCCIRRSNCEGFRSPSSSEVRSC